jgi:hypothetical protein
MGLGTKNRQNQTAEICKQHLRDKHRDKLGLIEEFIGEFEGVGKDRDTTRWSQFSDLKDIKEEMIGRGQTKDHQTQRTCRAERRAG